MILESERNLISILCAAQRKPDSQIAFAISKVDGIRAVSTFDVGTISLKLNKSAIMSEKDISFAVSSDRLKSIMSWMPQGDIETKLKGNELSFLSGKTKREITISDLEDVVSEVSIDEDSEDSVLIMNKEKFMEAVLFANSFKHKDPERASGYSCLHMKGNKLFAIGSDGAALGFYLYSQKLEFPESQILVGETQCASMIAIIKESKNVQMKFDGKKFGIFGEKIAFVGMQPSFDVPNYTQLLNQFSPRKTDGVKYDSNFAIVSTEDLKRATSHCGSIFGKDEYPYADLSFEKENLIVSSKSSSKGYDSVYEEITSKATDAKLIRLSTVLLNKSISRYDKICEISWKKDSSSNSPICISFPSDESVSSFVLLAPKMVKSEE